MGRTSSANHVPVLLYHRVARPENDWEARLSVDPATFEAQMRYLATQGMRACTLSEFTTWLDESAPLARGSFLLTFDDGFLDVYENAFPILDKLGWTATIFLISTLIGQSDIWCRHENPSGKSHALMNSGQIREMQARGFSFQSHTRTHPFLPKLSDDEIENELAGAQQELEVLLGEPVSCVAYPYGRRDERVVAFTRRAGYRLGFTCKPGLNTTGSDPLGIRRVEVFGSDRPATLARKMRLGTSVGTLSEALRFYPLKLVDIVSIKLFG